jgi:hypothetical protein
MACSETSGRPRSISAIPNPKIANNYKQNESYLAATRNVIPWHSRHLSGLYRFSTTAFSNEVSIRGHERGVGSGTCAISINQHYKARKEPCDYAWIPLYTRLGRSLQADVGRMCCAYVSRNRAKPRQIRTQGSLLWPHLQGS